jgi:O-antigen ligase
MNAVSLVDFALLLSAPIMFVVGLKRPERVLLLWLGLSPLSQDRMLLFGLDLRVVSFDRLACVAATLSLLATGKFKGLIPTRFSKFEKAVLVFICLFWAQAFVHFPLRDALSTCTNGLDVFGIPFYFYLLTKFLLTREGAFDERLEQAIFRTLSLVGLYCAAMGIYEGVTGNDLLPAPFVEGQGSSALLVGSEVRSNGPFWVAEILGEYLSLILLIQVLRSKSNRVGGIIAAFVNKATVTLYAAVLLAGMYFTMYRNVWLGFLGGYSLTRVLNPKSRAKFVMASVIVLLVGFVMYEALKQTALYRERLTNSENIYDRLGAWLYAFRAFSEHPIMGIGYGRLPHYIWSAQEVGDDLRFMDEVPATYHPHNTAVGLLAENGLVLAVPFALVAFFFLRQLWVTVHLAKSEADKNFGYFASGAAFAMLAPHMTDRCLCWNKYNLLLFWFFALVATHRELVTGSIRRRNAPRLERDGAGEPPTQNSILLLGGTARSSLAAR